MNASKPLDDASKTPMILSKPKCVGYFGINTERTCLLSVWQTALRRHELKSGFYEERGNLSFGCQGRKLEWKPHETESTDAEHRGGTTRMSDEASVMEVERRGCAVQFWKYVNHFIILEGAYD